MQEANPNIDAKDLYSVALKIFLSSLLSSLVFVPEVFLGYVMFKVPQSLYYSMAFKSSLSHYQDRII